MRARLGLVAAIVLAAVAAAGGGRTAAQFTATTANPSSGFTAAASFPTTCPTPGASYLTGFEAGVLPGPTFGGFEGTPSVDATVARTGTYSGKITKDTSGIEGFFQIVSPPATVSFAIRFPTLPVADVAKVMTVEESTSTQYVNIGYEAATQRLRLTSSAPGSAVASSTVTAGTWYEIDLAVDTASVPATASWRIDGVAQGSVPIALPVTVYLGWGSDVLADVFNLNVDDIFLSPTLADYPIGAVQVYALAPNATGTHSGATNFANDDNSAIGAGTPARLDEVPMTATTDFVKQITASATSYVEIGFADTTESCILGVEALATVRKPSNAPNTAKVAAFSGATETVLHNGDHDQLPITWAAKVTPSTPTWTAATVNGIVARFGYSTDVNPNPYLDAVHLEYAVQ